MAFEQRKSVKAGKEESKKEETMFHFKSLMARSYTMLQMFTWKSLVQCNYTSWIMLELQELIK